MFTAEFAVSGLSELQAIRLYEPEAIGPKAYAPVGERGERKFKIISAYSAASAVRYFLE
jgi:hypothetical protein